MRFGVRLGGGIWVVGGAALLIWALSARFLAAVSLGLLLFIVCFPTVLVVGVQKILASGDAARRRQASEILREGIAAPRSSGALGNAGIRASGVYFLGRESFIGAHPAKEQQLRAFYPDRFDQVFCAALFPDAGRARRAAQALVQARFDGEELRRLFSQPSGPQPVANAPVLAAPKSRPAGADATKANANHQDQNGSPMSTTRDFTQYRFNGETHGKGRLVLALVRKFVADNPRIRYDELRAQFPDRLQADSPVQFSDVQCVVAMKNALAPGDLQRFFSREDEEIELADGPILVSREWNRHNIQHVLERADKLGYVVDEVPGNP